MPFILTFCAVNVALIILVDWKINCIAQNTRWPCLYTGHINRCLVPLAFQCCELHFAREADLTNKQSCLRYGYSCIALLKMLFVTHVSISLIVQLLIWNFLPVIDFKDKPVFFYLWLVRWLP